MKIAMLTNNYKPFVGGVPVSIERLAGGLRALHNEVTVFAPSYGAHEHEEGVVRYRSKKKRLEGGLVIPDSLDKEIERQFCRTPYDIIHVHHPMLIGYTALYLGKKYRLPVVFTYHTRYEQYLHYLKPYRALQKRHEQTKNRFMRGIEGELLSFGRDVVVSEHNRIFTNKCDMVFVPTPMMKEYLIENGTVTPIEVLPTGISKKEFLVSPDKSAEIREMYGGGKARLFCTVSRLEKEKNLDFVLSGIHAYKQAYGGGFRLLVLGDGTRKGALQDRAAALGLSDNVLFLGCVEHSRLRDFYHACDLFVFASKSETQGIVLLEAMAAGLPVAAVRASGVCDVVTHGENGFLSAEDENEWASGIAHILEDPARLLSMKQKALETAAGYTEEEISKKALFLYKKAYAIWAGKAENKWRLKPVSGKTLM